MKLRQAQSQAVALMTKAFEAKGIILIVIEQDGSTSVTAACTELGLVEKIPDVLLRTAHSLAGSDEWAVST